MGTCKYYFSLAEASSKVFKNRRESRWNATLNEPVPRLISRFVWDLTQKSNFVPNKNEGQHLSLCFRNLLIRRSLPANSTIHRTCLALARELSSAKMEPTNPRAFSRTTFKEHRGKTSTHAPGRAFPVTFSVTLSNQSLSRSASFCVQLVVQLFCFMLLVFLTIEFAFMDKQGTDH